MVRKKRDNSFHIAVIGLVVIVILIMVFNSSQNDYDIDAELISEDGGITLEEAKNIVGEAGKKPRILYLSCDDKNSNTDNFVKGSIDVTYRKLNPDTNEYGDVKERTLSDVCTKKTPGLIFERYCKGKYPRNLKIDGEFPICENGCNNGICNPVVEVIASSSETIINSPPKGSQGITNCEIVAGWTCDPDDYSKSLEVRLYVDGPMGIGTYAGNGMASRTREQAVADSCGGIAEHGYKIQIDELNINLKDEKEHSIYVYSFESDSGESTLLLNSPKSITCGSTVSENYDIVIVGAGMGGISAAVQAARLGMNVVILEETDWIGGQMITVPAIDDVWYVVPHSRSGIYEEWLKRIQDHYASIGKTYWANKVRIEPHVGQNIYYEMLNEDGVTVKLRKSVINVLRNGNKVIGVTTSDGEQYNAPIIIDSTEYGDVIALSGARYRIGNKIGGEPFGNACVQDITYVGIIREYPEGLGDKAFLRMNTKLSSYDEHVNLFKQYVTVDGNPNLFDIRPVNANAHNSYRAGPNSAEQGDPSTKENPTKTSINWINDYPGFNLGVQLGIEYIEDKEKRFEHNCLAKARTLNFLYYMQNELGLSDWSLDINEDFDTQWNVEENLCPTSIIPQEYKELEKHLPPFPYVRESRRIIPVDTLTAAEIKRETYGSLNRASVNFIDSISVGAYFTDLHDCKTNEFLESNLGETVNDNVKLNGAFQVPLSSLIPESVDGFLVASKSIGVTRLAGGAVRLHPIEMHIGQAVGTLASLSIQKGINPREVDRFELQNVLLDNKLNLALYGYDDVTQDHQYWKDVQMVSVNGIMTGIGNGLFDIENNLNRVQTAIVLSRIFDLPLNSDSSFHDVSFGSFGYEYVSAINMSGITSGCQNNPIPLYCPSNKVTRGQIATFISRALELENTVNLRALEDVPSNHIFYNHIQNILNEGIMEECSNNKFCPSQFVTRGEMAHIMANVLYWKNS